VLMTTEFARTVFAEMRPRTCWPGGAKFSINTPEMRPSSKIVAKAMKAIDTIRLIGEISRRDVAGGASAGPLGAAYGLSFCSIMP